MVADPFDDEKLYGGRSALVSIVPDEMGRFKFELHSQYTREGLNSIQVGDLIAVENFRSSKGEEKRYSVLTITQALPEHFAAQSDGAYPGHIFESMRTIKEDWESQNDGPQYATTTIKCEALSTGWQFPYKDTDTSLPAIIEDNTLPMIGAEMRPLSRDMVEAILNLGLDRSLQSPLVHRTFEDLRVLLDKRALLTTHFGVFGFTNAGKSNLVSSLVTSLLWMKDKDGNMVRNPLNVILIDPNDEYLGLFIDQIIAEPTNFRYIHVGFDSLPQPIIAGLNNENTNLGDDRIDLLFRQMKLPNDLKKEHIIESYIKGGLKAASKRMKVAVPHRNLASWIRGEVIKQTDSRSGPAVKEALRDCIDQWCDAIGNSPIDAASIQASLDALDALGGPLRHLNGLADSQMGTARSTIDRIKRSLGRLRENVQHIPAAAIISPSQLVNEMNDREKSQIIIITGRRDGDVKEFASILGNDLYESRRRTGTLDPLTLLMLDEADLFIPNDDSDEATTIMKDMCVTYARRGRKFGLGIGIATQRASLLDTQVMANLHTYFVSKLPRKYDRDKVAEAFGIGEEQLGPTFTFRPGNWLLISHDATGLKGVPIPVRADNANERILNAARSACGGKKVKLPLEV